MTPPSTVRLLRSSNSLLGYCEVHNSDSDTSDCAEDSSSDSSSSSSAREPQNKRPKWNKGLPIAHIPDGCETVGASFARKSIARVFGGNLCAAIVRYETYSLDHFLMLIPPPIHCFCSLSERNDLGIKRMAFYRFDMNIKAPQQPLANGFIFVGLTRIQHRNIPEARPEPLRTFYQVYQEATCGIW